MSGVPSSVDLPYQTVKRFLDADADQRLLEWAQGRGIYSRGSHQHVEDGYAEAIHTLVDHWEENDGD